MTKLINFKKEISKISNEKSKVAILIHGMLTSKISMHNLKSALLLRKCYDKVHIVDMPITHQFIPYYFSKIDAENVVPKLEKKIKMHGSTGPIDIIGHSNGGYVALHLMNRLENVNYVFTIGTPSSKVLNLNFDLEEPCTKKIIHFVGDRDFFKDKLRMASSLTRNRFMIHFPDEGHCSIRSESDSNGLADIISYFNGSDSSHCFIDNKNILHIWPFCKREVSSNSKRNNIDQYMPIKVCNGIHDLDYNLRIASNKLRESEGLIQYLKSIFYMKKVYTKRIEEYTRAKNTLRPFGNKLKLEIENIDKDILKLRKINKTLEKKVIQNTNNFIEDYKKRIKKYQNPLVLSLKLSSMKNLSDEQLIAINGLLRESNNYLREFASHHQSKIKLNNPKKLL